MTAEELLTQEFGTLADVIRRNSGIHNLQKDVFFARPAARFGADVASVTAVAAAGPGPTGATMVVSAFPPMPTSPAAADLMAGGGTASGSAGDGLLDSLTTEGTSPRNDRRPFGPHRKSP